jgi:hypothetical protein
MIITISLPPPRFENDQVYILVDNLSFWNPCHEVKWCIIFVNTYQMKGKKKKIIINRR